MGRLETAASFKYTSKKYNLYNNDWTASQVAFQLPACRIVSATGDSALYRCGTPCCACGLVAVTSPKTIRRQRQNLCILCPETDQQIFAVTRRTGYRKRSA